MDRELRGEMFIAYMIGHESTPCRILRDFPRAAIGCPVEEARTCLWDRHAAQRALMWAVSDDQPLVASFLISDCGARVDKMTNFPGETGHALRAPMDVLPTSHSESIQEIVRAAYADIRLEAIVGTGGFTLLATVGECSRFST